MKLLISSKMLTGPFIKQIYPIHAAQQFILAVIVRRWGLQQACPDLALRPASFGDTVLESGQIADNRSIYQHFGFEYWERNPVAHPEHGAEIASPLWLQYQKHARGLYHPTDVIPNYETAPSTQSSIHVMSRRPYGDMHVLHVSVPARHY